MILSFISCLGCLRTITAGGVFCSSFSPLYTGFYLSTSPRSSRFSRGGQRIHEGTETTPRSASLRWHAATWTLLREKESLVACVLWRCWLTARRAEVMALSLRFLFPMFTLSCWDEWTMCVCIIHKVHVANLNLGLWNSSSCNIPGPPPSCWYSRADTQPDSEALSWLRTDARK